MREKTIFAAYQYIFMVRCVNNWYTGKRQIMSTLIVAKGSAFLAFDRSFTKPKKKSSTQEPGKP